MIVAGPEPDSGALLADRYRVHELIGEGGMGSVWRATDEVLHREVAIKRVRLDKQAAADVALARERTMREARIAAALLHPHIVTIFDVLDYSGEPCLVLEHVPSRSLHSPCRYTAWFDRYVKGDRRPAGAC
jgi:eukaryotic-like serine/threonine-protein kinase